MHSQPESVSHLDLFLYFLSFGNMIVFVSIT